MRELANNRVSEEILKTLWLQRLPANVQGILSVGADPNLATLAILADKILEVCDPRNSVCVVNNELPIRNRSRSPNADIADRIEALTRRFDEFESRYSSRLPRPRDRSRTRSKSPRRLSRSARQKVDDGSWLCRYHFRFDQVNWSHLQSRKTSPISPIRHTHQSNANQARYFIAYLLIRKGVGYTKVFNPKAYYVTGGTIHVQP
ncbi:unnamed protein product [Nesidiocoris tenuis]|uniref:Uncharacterized protein n=1 Tax=Nesidiocoris tenuis TaxID=355587 RepID=A0A6H5GWR0_9HEMI|nr:unnamed protein product [Nesidiocoris tenuis]